MVNDIDPIDFHKSIATELNSVKNRVRNLIGNAHWGEEGRYKEAVLRSIIRRFLPANYSLGTGFVLKKRGASKISKQIDIIVYDNTYPILFREGDFIITTPENVKGIIEVKTRLNLSTLHDIILKASNNGKLLRHNTFNGIFFFEGRTNGRYNICDRFRHVLEERGGIVNHICIGKNVFCKYWHHSPLEDSNQRFYRFYRMENLAVSYFISNLIISVCNMQMIERSWFYFPIPEGKEARRICDVAIQRFNRHNI